MLKDKIEESSQGNVLQQGHEGQNPAKKEWGCPFLDSPTF
ncbi:hypothetical protein BAOM_1366 [Peribacillus asahii]|uniref:Uncharacterized protein n=1 Tax=Peribacillus asahii TaxID=228899 RepID=A0A3T0KNJ2_9BACI|nr:hypothetical protein BAOM_1366 [Peribacillus asahii]